MSQFLNPYHFVPLPSAAPHTETLESSSLHHAHQQDRHSGSITFDVKIISPTLCGNTTENREPWTKLIHPAVDQRDNGMIPGSSLRGVISSMVEAVTHSSLRVLKNTALSQRKIARGGGMSAIGILVSREGCLYLRPLTLPTLAVGNRTLEDKYRPYFRHEACPLLKAYFHHYNRHAHQHPLQDSYSSESLQFFYARLPHPPSLENNTLQVDAPITDSRTSSFILAQALNGHLLSEAAYAKLPDDQKQSYTRGILRILGKPGRDLPNTKKHEYFIPYPPEAENIPIFPVQDAVDRFHLIADLRTEEDSLLPYELKGTSRNSPPNSDLLRLRENDLVFFRPSEDGSAIEEIAVSSIWRSYQGTVHEFFASVHPDLLPQHGQRHNLTMAESMFGIVEDLDKERTSDAPAKALASRLQFLDCHVKEEFRKNQWIAAREMWSQAQRDACATHHISDIPLKNLASPKVPCPNLYFTMRKGEAAFIRKGELTREDHKPQGHKFYLSRNLTDFSTCFIHPSRLNEKKELAGIAKQHQSFTRALRPDTILQGEIRFQQLTAVELGALLYSLMPCENFRHLIGHGKPLGLGQCEIHHCQLTLTDYAVRYRSFENSGKEQAPVESYRQAYLSWSDETGIHSARHALERIGTSHVNSPNAPVHYPQVDGIDTRSPEFERELFQWFTQNENTTNQHPAGQFLRPLADAAGHIAAAIPKLERALSENPPATNYQTIPRNAAPADVKELLKKTWTFRALAPDRDGRVPFVFTWQGHIRFEQVRFYAEVVKSQRAPFAKAHPAGSECQAEVLQADKNNRQIKLTNP